MKSLEQIQQAIAAQRNAARGSPHFAPADGICWSCGKQIYELKDGTTYITGCPWCHRSYCD